MPLRGERFCGNPAAVVLDADVLEEQEMRRIARELAGFEVAFVLGSDSPDYDVELRFFSPRREVGFVGHATVAAHYVRAMADGVPHGKVRQKSAAGIVGVEVSGKAPNLRVTIDQTPATFGPIVPEERLGPVLDALGISSSSLHPACPVQVMSTANSRLLLGLQSPDTLESLQPKMDQLIHLTSHVGADGFFVFAVKPGAGPDDHRVAHVLPGHRRARGSGQRQRARHAWRVPVAQRAADSERQARRRSWDCRAASSIDRVASKSPWPAAASAPPACA